MGLVDCVLRAVEDDGAGMAEDWHLPGLSSETWIWMDVTTG